MRLNRSIPVNGRVANVHSEGARFRSHYQMPVAPQRHRERETESEQMRRTSRSATSKPRKELPEGTPIGRTPDGDSNAGRCSPSHAADVSGCGAFYWSSPHDGRSWTEEAGKWIVGSAVALGLALLVYGIIVLAFVAGPGR